MRYLILLTLSGTLQAATGFLLPVPWNVVGICLGPLVLGWVLTRQQSPTSSLERVFAYYLIFVPFLGPFATFGALIATAVLLFQRRQTALEKYRDQVDGATEVTELDKVRFQLTENLWMEDNEAYAEPFIDIMKGSDRFLKQRAIDKVIQHPSHLSVEILREGLKDGDADVRYYAASGLIQLNDLFQWRLNQFKQDLEKFPSDAELWFKLGSGYDQYCFWGLPSQDAVEGFLDQAEACYQKCIELNPKHEQGYLALGRLWVRIGNIDPAISILQAGLKAHPQSISIMGWLAEAYYKGRRFSALEKFAWECSLYQDLPDNLAEPFHYWAFGGPISDLHDQLYHESSS